MKAIAITPAQETALFEAAELHETEANQLASFMERDLKVSFSRCGIDVSNCLVPHRVAIALHREIKRLRAIVEEIRAINPPAKLEE